MSTTALFVGMFTALCLDLAIGLTVDLSLVAAFCLGAALGSICCLIAHIGIDR